jgi:hypothetical protein
MAYWEICLMYAGGSCADIASFCTTPRLAISKSIRGYHVRSTEFEALNDPIAVHALAQERIAQLNGLARLAIPGYKAVELCPSVTRNEDDGTSKTWVFHRPLVQKTLGDNASAAAIAVRSETIVARIDAARNSAGLTEALSYFGRNGQDWVSLYKVLELVQKECGAEIERSRWASKAEIRLFTQTANSADASGDAARHSTGARPPARPMTLPQAVALIARLLDRWVDFAVNKTYIKH